MENNTAKKTIIIIDDQPFILKALSRLLKASGYLAKTAENGYLGLLKVINDIPSLIILDLNMPIMDGFTLIDKIKSNSTLARIPIIVLTCFSDMDIVKRCKDKGVNEYMVKPYNQRVLLTKIEQLIGSGAVEKADKEKPEKPKLDKGNILVGDNKASKMKIGEMIFFDEIYVNDLIPGMVIADHIKSDKGMILLTSGTVITNIVIKRLQDLKISTVKIKK